ncbi:MAG: hypothetical protein ACOYVK_14805 [Bacillota bacterium]
MLIQKRGKGLKILAIVLVIGLLGGYVFYFTGLVDTKPRDERTTRITSEEADEEAEKVNQLSDKLFRLDSQGEVQVGALLVNPIEDDPDYLVFKTQFNTHSVDLDGYAFKNMAVFKTSDGLVLKDEIIWEKADGDGHHYLGNYKIPKKINGKPVIQDSTNSIELIIVKVDGIEERPLVWEKEVLGLLR